jgi:hypothetical protein
MKDQLWHKDKVSYGFELGYSLNAASNGGLICGKAYS